MTPLERFNNLPARVRDEILDKHRNWNVEHLDWWDGVYEMFTQDMEKIGIEVDKMYFSGFWSQGDGACFEGRVRDWPLFLASLGYKDAALIDHADAQFRLYVHHSGHYYHENCTMFEIDLPLPEHDEDQDFIDGYCPHEPESLHEAAWMALINGYSHDSLEQEFTEAFKDHMRELYNRLEVEYDHLTSDESVLEALDANDMLEELIEEFMESEDA